MITGAIKSQIDQIWNAFWSSDGPSRQYIGRMETTLKFGGHVEPPKGA